MYQQKNSSLCWTQAACWLPGVHYVLPGDGKPLPGVFSWEAACLGQWFLRNGYLAIALNERGAFWLHLMQNFFIQFQAGAFLPSSFNIQPARCILSP